MFVTFYLNSEKSIAQKKSLWLDYTCYMEMKMRSWNGSGVFQWEHVRQWNLATASIFCRAEGALMVPGALTSFSLFFRRQSQSASSTFDLQLWTTPIFFKPLDEQIDSTTAPQYLMPVKLETGGGTLSMVAAGGGPGPAQVFGARFKSTEPMGSLLFWEMKNAGSDANIIGDIYLVPNNSGTISGASFGRVVDGDVGCTHPANYHPRGRTS